MILGDYSCRLHGLLFWSKVLLAYAKNYEPLVKEFVSTTPLTNVTSCIEPLFWAILLPCWSKRDDSKIRGMAIGADSTIIDDCYAGLFVGASSSAFWLKIRSSFISWCGTICYICVVMGLVTDPNLWPTRPLAWPKTYKLIGVLSVLRALVAATCLLPKFNFLIKPLLRGLNSVID